MDFAIRAASITVTVIAPAFISIKIVSKNDKNLLKSWIKLLTVLLLFTNVHHLLRAVPSRHVNTLNDLVMLIVSLWLASPLSQGYIIIFNQLFQPFFSTAKLDVVESIRALKPIEHNKSRSANNYSNLIFEDYVNRILKWLHLFLLRFLNFLFGFKNKEAGLLNFFQRNVKTLAPFFYSLSHRFYRKLKSIDSDIKHLQKRHERKMQIQSSQRVLGTGTGNSEDINNLKDLSTLRDRTKHNTGKDSDGGSLVRSGKSSRRPTLKEQGSLFSGLKLDDSISKNYYVEYIVLQYKEKTNSLLFFNIALSATVFLMNFIFNYALLAYYKLVGIVPRNNSDQVVPKTAKKVSFVERALSFPSLKSPLGRSLSRTAPNAVGNMDKNLINVDAEISDQNTKIPAILLTPASPTFADEPIQLITNQFKLSRKHSKSVGADSRMLVSSILAQGGRKRRNTFRDFLKCTSKYGFNSLSRSANNNGGNLAADPNKSSRLGSSIVELGNSGFLESPSKVSTIEETSLIGDAVDASNSLFMKSLNDLTPNAVVKSSSGRANLVSNHSLVNTEENLLPLSDSLLVGPIQPLQKSLNLSLNQANTSEPAFGTVKEKSIALPTMASPIDLNTPQAINIISSDPFSAIFASSPRVEGAKKPDTEQRNTNGSKQGGRSSSPSSRSTDSGKRRSFKLFRKSQESPGIDESLVESSNFSQDSARPSMKLKSSSSGRNSVLRNLKTKSPSSSNKGIATFRETVPLVDSHTKPSSNGTKIEEKTRANKDAYATLVGELVPLNAPLENDKFLGLNVKGNESSQELGMGSVVIRNTGHTPQASTGSFGVKYIHSFTPNLKKLEKMAGEEVPDIDSIDYLTYQHPFINTFEAESAAQPYLKSPLYKKDIIEASGSTSKRLSLTKRNSLKDRLKRLSGNGSKASKDSSSSGRPEHSHHHLKEKPNKVFKHRRGSYASFIEEPCTY